MKTKKSDDYYVDIPEGVSKAKIMKAVEHAAQSAGLYISHIGGYSRTRYPNAVHWHFKREPKEAGLLDATYWDVKSLFWLMIRHSEPKWVKDMVPVLLRELKKEMRKLGVATRRN